MTVTEMAKDRSHPDQYRRNSRSFGISHVWKRAVICAALSALPLVAGAEGWPRSVPHEAGELTLKQVPERIVSTTPSVTGILLAIDAPVIASAATAQGPLTDDKGFFSQWAEVADQRGVQPLYPDLQFDIEAIIGAAPDLLIASANGGDSVMQFYPEIEALGLPALVVDYSTHSWQDIARQLGRATGHEAEAEAAIKRFDSHAAKAAANMTLPKGKATIVGYNIAGSYSVGRPESPQAQVLTALGFDIVPIPDDMQGEITRSSNFDFVSRENLSAAIPGETVFLMSGSDEDVQAFMDDPVLANHPAVKAGRVYPLGRSSFRIDYYSGLQMIDKVAGQFGTP
ncbi:Fe2+-enterobactin ABC transporter substrate-binding protein [Paracoccus onubensis]|nr:Fe2+-enterobactin ABC transporter substrate-binding protein [Paracoccus onubensis]